MVPGEELESLVESTARALVAKSSYVVRTTKEHVEAVMDEIASTARSTTDADVLVYALHDPESRTISREYLAGRKQT